MEKLATNTQIAKRTQGSLQILSAKTAEQALAVVSPTMAALCKQTNREGVYLWIMDEITAVSKFLSVGKNINAFQKKETAILIYENYYWLKPEELHLCFEKGKCGDYGQIYDRLDGSVLMEWLRRYDAERTAAVETVRTITPAPVYEKSAEIDQLIYEIHEKLAKGMSADRPTTEYYKSRIDGVPELDLYQKLLLANIYAIEIEIAADKKKKFTVADLCKRANLDEATLKKNMDFLEEKGYVTIKGNRIETNTEKLRS